MCMYIYIYDITVIGFSDIRELDKHRILELDTNSRWICGDISDYIYICIYSLYITLYIYIISSLGLMWYYCEISMGYKSGSEKSGDVTVNGKER